MESAHAYESDDAERRQRELGRALSATSALNAVDDVRVELRPGAALELGERVLVREPAAVDALGRHRVVGVGDEEDPRAERDRRRRRGGSGSRRRPSARGGGAPRSRPARRRASRASGSRSAGAARARAARPRSAGPACGGSPRGWRACRGRAGCPARRRSSISLASQAHAGRDARGELADLVGVARRCRRRARRPRGRGSRGARGSAACRSVPVASQLELADLGRVGPVDA